MSRWWRAYDEAVDDPKLILLTDRQHRAWFNLLCIASQNEGTLPAVSAIAVKLRVTAEKARGLVAELTALELIDHDGNGVFAPHNWNGRQYHSDVTDPTNAKRQKRYRERHGVTAKTVTATVTPPAVTAVTVKRPDTDTDTETERIKDTADAVSPKYAFESGIIRLKAVDFEKWKQAFSYLDLPAELIGLTEWAGQQGPKRWFSAVSGALAKRNREAKAAKDRAKDGDGFKWNGIEGVI